MHPTLFPLLLLGLSLPAQDEPLPVHPHEIVPKSYVVMFTTRSFDLDVFRDAIYARRPAAQIDTIVKGLEVAAVRDQAEFTQAVTGLGGRVISHYWLINGACVADIADDKVADLRALPNVAEVHPNRVYRAVNNTARNATHHEADQANARQTSGGAFVTGRNVSVAVLDTGIDRLYAATGLPNPAFYVGGSQSNMTGGGLNGSRVKAVYGVPSLGNVTEDGHGHGTHVSGSVGSDAAGFRGMAPGSWLVGIKVASDQGAGNTNTLVEGWQTVAARRTADSILVANNSMSGSPSLTEPAQVALDSAAFNADVLCVVAAGNGGTNTTNSQNAWNGLAVGAIVKNSLTVASFSGQGPLASFGRTYPDISAVGVGVISVNINSAGGVISDGTSMASPMVAGGAACVRQVDPLMTAREAKALLLARTKHVLTSRNTYGLGVLDIDAAVAAALVHDYGKARLTNAAPVWRRQFNIPGPGSYPIAITWMHPPGGGIDNLDLRIRDGANNVIASDLNTLNSYEKVNIIAFGPGTVTAEVTWVSPVPTRNIDFAISGVGSLLPTVPPTLTNLTPATVNNPAPAEITLTGTDLDGIDRITVGGVDLTAFTVVSPTTVRFTLPGPFLVGTHNVTASNVVGTSNPLQVTVNGVHPMVLTAPPFSARGIATNLSGIGDRGWVTVVFASTSTVPSNLPGFVSLNMGNNFSELIQLAIFGNDNRGAWALTLVVPTSLPPGFGLLFQAVTVDPLNLVPPLETSNRGQTQFF
jgi:hypothetical protein